MERGKLKLLKINRVFTLLIFVLFIGVALRAQELISHNFLFLLDQGRDMMAVKSILYDHHLTLIGPSTSLRGVFQGPLWYYLLAASTAIFGGDPWGGIVLMFAISIAVLFVVYFWIKRLFGEKAAIISLFLFSVSPEAVAAATYAWNPHPMWLLLVLYIFSFYKLVSFQNKSFHLIVWPLIALMFHFQTALAVFMLIGSFIFLLIFSRNTIRQKHFLCGLIIASILFMPQVLFELRHDFLMTRSVLNIFSGSDQGLFVGGENKNYFALIRSNISLFYYNFSTSFVRDGYLKDLPRIALFVIIASLILQKKLRLFDKKEWRFMIFNIKIIGIIAGLSFLYPFPLRYWFLTGFQSFYLIFIGVILARLFRFRVGKIVIIFLFLTFVFYSAKKIDALYIHPPNDGGFAKIKGKLSAIDYLYKDAKGKSFGLLVFTPSVLTDPYDYLLWWYGNKLYHYIPHQNKKGTFYLLIEPDSSKPWSYKGWLETVIKTGLIQETKELPSGIIIQKRYLTSDETKE